MSYKLPADVADRLLDRLIEDDGFRDRFQANPQAALAEVGYTVSGDEWGCMQSKVLPSKETLRATRETLLQQFMTTKPDVIFRITV